MFAALKVTSVAGCSPAPRFLPLDSGTNVFAIILSFKFGSGEKVHKKTTKEETFNAIFQAVRVGNIRKET